MDTLPAVRPQLAAQQVRLINGGRRVPGGAEVRGVALGAPQYLGPPASVYNLSNDKCPPLGYSKLLP